MAGHYIGLVGVLYAIVLGFVVVTAWEQFNRADEASTNEQLYAYDLFNTIAFYDYNNAKDLKVRNILSSLSDYAGGMPDEGQQMLLHEGLYSREAGYREPSSDCTLPITGSASTPEPASILNDHRMVVLRCRILQLKPITLRDQAVYASSLRLLTDLSDIRTTRRHHYASPALQPEMWTAFVIGGFILVGILYLVETSSRGQRVRAMAVGSMIGTMWALALIFNNPFYGTSPISFEPWCYIGKAFATAEDSKPSPDPSCKTVRARKSSVPRFLRWRQAALAPHFGAQQLTTGRSIGLHSDR